MSYYIEQGLCAQPSIALHQDVPAAEVNMSRAAALLHIALHR